MFESPITFSDIEREYQRALSECFEILPETQWAHHPQKITLTKHKTKYGMADRNGTVYISEAFISTNAYTKLRNTLRHELAHLAAGIREKHSVRFRKMEHAFGAKQHVSKEELTSVHDNMPFKWTLLAHLNDGTQIKIGEAHRRSKKYLSYTPSKHHYATLEGKPIDRFTYLENNQ